MCRWRKLLIVAATAALAACAGTAPPTPPAPTIATLSIVTADDMNPNDAGKPTPVVVRVFRLAAPTAFQRAAYDDLFEKDEATLGADLVGTVDILVEPGMSETFNRVLGERDRWLGFVVTYRDAESAQWRALVPLRPYETTRVDVEVGRRGIVASTVEPPSAAQ